VRTILHVDMDAFYASVEELDNPELRGLPLVVGGLGGRGVVAAASYAVRKFGVRSAMPMREAMRRCPQLVSVAPRFKRYQEISARVFEIFHEFTPLVQGLSLDEAFLDVTASRSAIGSGEEIATRIKALIHERTGLTASVGVAPNKLVAKIASDLRKPDGLVIVPAFEVRALLDTLPIRKLFGIGERTASRLEEIGITSLAELRNAALERLEPVLGSHARSVQQRAAGIDDRPVVPNALEKQVSAEETFDQDLRDHEQMRAALVRLADRMAGRLRSQQWLTERIVVKIRRGDFRTYTRQAAVKPATHETRAIAKAATGLLDAWLEDQPDAAVRLLGVGANDLTDAPQLELFQNDDQQRDRRLDAATDQIRARFGGPALTRASALTHPDKARKGRSG
jgi:DNA polymerase IV